MRYFIICDDSGNPIYYDHPEGMMACLIFNGLDQFLTERDEHFSQKFKSMWCGGVLFVAQKYKNLSFLVVSDQGESEMYLRTLLRQIFEHMVMLFGLQVMLEGKYTSFTRHKKTLQHIIDTTCTLGDRHQALLVRATERLEVNDRTRGECFNALKNTVQNEKLITHALVFVGTKLLVSYSRGGKSQDIDPSDLLLLINDFHATFHPPNREVEEMELPIADYRDHSNITIRGAQIPRGVDGQVDAPSEPPAEDYDGDKAAAAAEEAAGQTDAPSEPPTRAEGSAATDHAEVEDERERIDNEQQQQQQQPGEAPQGTENGRGIHEIAQSASAATLGARPAAEEEEAEKNDEQAAAKAVEENEGQEELKEEELEEEGEEEEVPVPGRRDGDGGSLPSSSPSPPPGHAGDGFGDDGEGETAVAREEVGTGAACDGAAAAAHTEDPRNAVRHDAGSTNVPSDPSQQDHHQHHQPVAPPPSTPSLEAAAGETNEEAGGEPARSPSPVLLPEKAHHDHHDHDHDHHDHDHHHHQQQQQEADEPPHAHTRGEKASETTTTTAAAAAEEEGEGGGADGTKGEGASEEAAGEEDDGEEEEEEEFLLRNDEEYDPTKLTKYKALHLRTPRYAPFWVYYAELGRKTTLVVLTSNNPQTGAKGTPEERQELDRVRDTMRGLLQSYSTYLITKEHTHLPILSFLHQFPGLVHFIFVDRTFNRVIAPSISALHAMDRPPDEEEERNMKRVIKRLVWDMCYDSQQHLSEGAQSVLVKSGPWQYSYRLWVEDVDGFELIFPPEVPFGTPHVPQTNKFYQKLMHRFFPTRGNLRCYELFTLYLSTLSVETVAHHDRELVSVLLNRTMK